MSPVPSVRSFFRSSSASLLPPSHPVHRPKPNLAWIPAWIVGPRHDDLRPVRPRRFINARPRHSLLFFLSAETSGNGRRRTPCRSQERRNKNSIWSRGRSYGVVPKLPHSRNTENTVDDQFSNGESSGGGFRRKMERERHRGAKPLIDSPVRRFLFHRWWRFPRIGTRRAFGGCAWRLSHRGETKTSVSR